MLDRADCADFGCHNSIRLETKHFLNTLALTFISFSGRFVFAMQKHYLFFFASDPLVIIGRRGFGCEDEYFGGVTFDIIFCMSRFNHVPSGDTLRRDVISSYY